MINQLCKILLANMMLIVNLLPIVSSTDNKHNQNGYNNLFVLGDSLSDTGAFVQYQGHWEEETVRSTAPNCDLNIGPMPINRLGARPCLKLVKEWKPKLFNAPFYENSFCNGPVAVQVLANLLKINSFKSGSYDEQNFDNFGYNYSTGGAKVLTSDELVNFEIFSIVQARSIASERFNLQQQVAMLKHQHKDINLHDLILINIGNNDLSEIVYVISLLDDKNWKEFFMKRLDKVVNTLFVQVEELMRHGFKHIVVFNNVDFSKTPRYHNDSQKSQIIKEVVGKYNELFDVKFIALSESLEFKRIVKKFDFNIAFSETLNEFRLKNKITTKAAVDINWAINLFFNNIFQPYFIDGANYDNINNYAFFDGVHPTGPFHNRVAEKLHNFVNDKWN